MKNGRRISFEFLRVMALAIALWLAPIGALATGDVPLSAGDVRSSRAIVETGVGELAPPVDCTESAQAAAHPQCCQSYRDAPPAGAPSLRVDPDDLPPFRSSAVILQGFPADVPTPSAQNPVLTYSRFILFGSFRS